MKEIPVSKFKADCSSFIGQVRETRKAIRITRRGKAIAEIIPVPRLPKGPKRLGRMKETFEILGDIESPIIDLGAIEVLKD